MSRKKVEINENKAKRLRECIEQTGLTQKEFAKKVGYGEQNLSAILNNRKNLSDTLAEDIERVFGFRADYLLDKSPFRTYEELEGYRVLSPILGRVKTRSALDAFFDAVGLEFIPTVQNSDLSAIDFINLPKDERKKTLEEWLEDSPTYYRIEKDNQLWGYCSKQEKDAFYQDLLDYMDYKVTKLCGGRNNNGKEER